MFRVDNSDHIIDVNKNNLPGEYDQVNIICPVSKPGTVYPERHVVYSVTKEEFDSCRITNPKPRIVALCNDPFGVRYFTHTFRSFTPTPGGLEFLPGREYYFISTSSRSDLHRRVGGGCSTFNMKLIFKVFDNSKSDENNVVDVDQELFQKELTEVISTTEKSRHEFIYYYHPRDLIDNRVSNKKISRDYDNELWKKEALRYTSSSNQLAFSSVLILLVSILYFIS